MVSRLVGAVWVSKTYQTDEKKPLVWRNHTKAKGWKKPGHMFHNSLAFFQQKTILQFLSEILHKKGFHINVRYVIRK